MKNLQTLKLIFLFLFFFVGTVMLAQMDYSLSINQFLLAKQKVNEINGVVLVARNNEIVYQQAFGLANRETRNQCNEKTAFRIGAISEQFIAASILRLEQNGKLKINDAIVKYFPQFNRSDFYKGNVIKIHQLLTHTSGLPDFTEWPEVTGANGKFVSRDSLLSLIVSKNLIDDPGAKVHNNKTNYFILECLIEKLSGKLFRDFIKENVFHLTGLNESGFLNQDTQPEQLSQSYKPVKGAGYTNELLSNAYPLTATQLYCTAGDLLKWHVSFYDTLFLSALSNRRMHTTYNGLNGYGVFVDVHCNKRRYYSTGFIGGFRTCFLQLPFEGVCIVVLLNDGGNALAIAEALSACILNVPFELPYVHNEVKLKTKYLKRFAGVYKSYFNMEIKLFDGKLYRTIEGLKTIEVKPESETKLFFADGTDRQLQFLFNDKDEVVKLWFVKNSVKEEIKLGKQ